MNGFVIHKLCKLKCIAGSMINNTTTQYDQVENDIYYHDFACYLEQNQYDFLDENKNTSMGTIAVLIDILY
ncbi:hypothetical protein AK824_11465 [Psychrobacter sp. P11G3]|nr:hypothetical protein AK824_11465 [Psychrobacter sp. P11G3]